MANIIDSDVGSYRSPSPHYSPYGGPSKSPEYSDDSSKLKGDVRKLTELYNQRSAANNLGRKPLKISDPRTMTVKPWKFLLARYKIISLSQFLNKDHFRSYVF